MSEINVEQAIAEYKAATDDHDRSHLASCLLSHPDCPVEILEEWMFFFPEQAIKNIALDLWLLADPDLIERASYVRLDDCVISLIDIERLLPGHRITRKAIEINKELADLLNWLEVSSGGYRVNTVRDSEGVDFNEPTIPF